MKKYLYCRVSTAKQNIERQERNLLSMYPDGIVVKEVFTRTKFQGRKEWDKIMRVIKKGDLIAFDSVSRMSGNADEGCEIYELLFNKGVSLVFRNEPHINTDVYKQTLESQIQLQLSTGNAATDNLINTIIDALNKYTIELAKQQIRLAFEQSEKEVEDLRQRTKEGIETARLDGKQIGRIEGRKYTSKKEIAAKEIILKNSKDFNGTNTDSEVMKIAGISRNSYYKYKAEKTEFSEIVTSIRELQCEEIQNALYRKAIGFHETDTKTYWRKPRGADDNQAEFIYKEDNKKYYPPDVSAGLILLKHWDKKQQWTNDPLLYDLKKTANDVEAITKLKDNWINLNDIEEGKELLDKLKEDS